jgi:hypothetical protein
MVPSVPTSRIQLINSPQRPTNRHQSLKPVSIMTVPIKAMIAKTTMPKMWARLISGAATLTRPARPRLMQSKIGDRTYTRPPMIRHIQRPGVAASMTSRAVTVGPDCGCWAYGGGLNQPGVPGAGKGADPVLAGP